MKKHTITLIIMLCIGVIHSNAQHNRTLKFNEKGEFKVAQFTDIHWNNKADNCKETTEVILNVLNTEKPDFAILTGDIVAYNPDREGWASISKIFSEAKIPWAVLMGNHDAEQSMSREEMYSFLDKQPYYIGEIGPKEIHGTGNFILPIMGSKSNKKSALLYCLDSNDYTDNPLKHGYYDWIRFNQIDWYRNNSLKFTKENDGVVLPALAYFHIPLPEYEEVITAKKYYGEKREGDKTGAPVLNSGFFTSIIEMGDIMGTFVGHDHNNSFIGLKNDIALAYGRVTGINAYGELDRGSRIVQLYEDKFKFDTWIRTNSGTSDLFYYPSGITQEEEKTSFYHNAHKLEAPTQGVNYKYFEYEGKIKSVHQLADAKISKLIKEGKIKNFTLEPMERDDFFGMEYEAWINIPKDGIYKFYTYTDDGSLLYINDELVVDNDGSHSAKRADGRIALKAGYHKMKILYFESYMGESIEIGISSRDILETVIPNQMLFVNN